MNGCSMPAPAPCAITASAFASGAVLSRAETVCVPTGRCRRSAIARRLWPKLRESGRGRAVPGHLGVCVRRMEGTLLPADVESTRHAAVLLEPVPVGRGQLHVPPATRRDDARRLARRDAGWLSLHPEGASTHHALDAPGRSRRGGLYDARSLRAPRRAARAHPVRVPADPHLRPSTDRALPGLPPADLPLRGPA